MSRRLTVERRNEIVEMLLKNGNLKASEIAKQFGVSTETIRKDLIYLDQQGIAKKGHGSAVIRKPVENMLEEAEQVKDMTDAEDVDIEKLIASKAVEFIPQNGVVLLDSESISYELAKKIVNRNDLTIFTNSIECLSLLMESDNQIFALGGKVYKNNKGIMGGWANQILNTVSIDVAFLGSGGFSNFTGPTTESFEAADFKHHVLTHSNKVVILAKNNRFIEKSLFQFCEWDKIHALITNKTENENVELVAKKIQKSTEIFYV